MSIIYKVKIVRYKENSSSFQRTLVYGFLGETPLLTYEAYAMRYENWFNNAFVCDLKDPLLYLGDNAAESWNL